LIRGETGKQVLNMLGRRSQTKRHYLDIKDFGVLESLQDIIDQIENAKRMMYGIHL
jgi:hypothetical protein